MGYSEIASERGLVYRIIEGVIGRSSPHSLRAIIRRIMWVSY